MPKRHFAQLIGGLVTAFVVIFGFGIYWLLHRDVQPEVASSPSPSETLVVIIAPTPEPTVSLLPEIVESPSVSPVTQQSLRRRPVTRSRDTTRWIRRTNDETTTVTVTTTSSSVTETTSVQSQADSGSAHAWASATVSNGTATATATASSN